MTAKKSTGQSGNKSAAPTGEAFPLPTEGEYMKEFGRLEALAKANREKGREIVVVMGVGFVGAVMAAVVADATNDAGEPNKFVIGMQRPSIRSYWKIPLLNRGVPPVKAEDPEVDEMIHRCVVEKETLTVTYTYDALKLADVVVVDVQCDYLKEDLGNVRTGRTDMAALEESFHIIAERIPPECLVLIETTVAPGTTEQIAYPIIKKAFRMRGIETEPLLAHSYERVMPGRDYVASIRDFWRVCSGVNDESRRRVEQFLNDVLNTKEYPLTVLDRPIESETAKVVENSFRATTLAFMDEWSLFAERNGVDLMKVIDAIRARPTHKSMLFPGPGIGGYCLPKDGGLGLWAYKHLHGGMDDIFRMTAMAIDINDTRSLHVAEITRDALRNMGRPVAMAEILLCGASYREDVGDTRYSGSELVVRKLTEMGAEMRVHDPYVETWWEFASQDTYPAPGRSLARFFRNQEKLKELVVQKDFEKALEDCDAVIFAVRHEPYLNLSPDAVVEAARGPIAVIDCFCLLDDDKIRRYFELGCEVKGLGRGHMRHIKESIQQR
ncbi:MAG: nucleotide sugar dehydrogenase [Candidatus Latescibacteria bacterium]|nr:nucleotide sugar dehydrogenase [Candidatus Latescibacterota bacterium]NIM22011.1 nucleotide sugar dehydrogenase [Candidatus Latescibacterota bacterium]NIM66029.1 nucleotide sugar dehydrogenase [Candidatus Latescibacterota bacterium]NIO02437.1 nucleotide sugar dehydrogenase [Candidatus Latescibacterota bacterium]NIO29348.1 nucleotide sugar dehydrogenase [Candidatus Latescibacterota bacterium]